MKEEIQQDREVQREPFSPQTTIEEIEKTFVFNNAPTPDQVKLCKHIETWGTALAIEIASLVPEGKEQIMAINSVLSSVIWCRHAIMRQPTIEMVATDPVPEMSIRPAVEDEPCGPTCTCHGSPS